MHMGALFIYEPAALTTELWALANHILPYPFSFGKREFLRFTQTLEFLSTVIFSSISVHFFSTIEDEVCYNSLSFVLGVMQLFPFWEEDRRLRGKSTATHFSWTSQPTHRAARPNGMRRPRFFPGGIQWRMK